VRGPRGNTESPILPAQWRFVYHVSLNLYILPASGWWSHSLPMVVAFAPKVIKCDASGITMKNGRRDGFINIKDMYNNDGGQGGGEHGFVKLMK
jgi:hypothetical protein